MDKKSIFNQTQKIENELTKLKNIMIALQATGQRCLTRREL